MSTQRDAMVNAYEVLNLKPSLVIDRDALSAAYREVGKQVHPDAGGDENQFAALQAAYETLQSPAKRLAHWLELRGLVVEKRGTIGPEMMEWFSRVGEVSQRVEALIRKREASKTALGLAMLEGETHRCREQVEKTIAALEAVIGQRCSVFGDLEQSGEIDAASASELHRDLRFFEKWRASLRGLYARLL